MSGNQGSGNLPSSRSVTAILGEAASIDLRGSRGGAALGGGILAGVRATAGVAQLESLTVNGHRRPATPSHTGLVIPVQTTHRASSAITWLSYEIA